MSDVLNIKSPWTIVWLEFVDDFIKQIKKALPPDHELHGHTLFPGIKREGRSVFIVDDDTTRYKILIDLENGRRWKKTKHQAPAMRVFKDDAEIAAMIEHDHQEECAKLEGSPGLFSN